MNNIDFNFSLIFILLAIVETIGQQLMIPFFYRFGITCNKTSFSTSIESNIEINKILAKDEGKFKFISKQICIFTSKVHFFSFFRVDTFIPIKSICTIKNNKCEVISKLPLIITLYLFFSIISHLSRYFTEANNSSNNFNSTFPIIFLVIFIIMYLIELGRLGTKKKELKEIL